MRPRMRPASTRPPTAAPMMAGMGTPLLGEMVSDAPLPPSTPVEEVGEDAPEVELEDGGLILTGAGKSQQ